MNKYAPPEWRRTPYGQEKDLVWVLKEYLEKRHAIHIGDDGTGLAWDATINHKRISGPASSLTSVVFGAVRYLVEGREDE